MYVSLKGSIFRLIKKNAWVLSNCFQNFPKICPFVELVGPDNVFNVLRDRHSSVSVEIRWHILYP